MASLGELWRRIVFLFHRKQMERDLADEMLDHLERKAATYAAAGMNPAEALNAAKRQLGNAALQQELSRASWGFPTLESIWQDVRYGLRGLRQSPGFSTVAILTLALGIGATTAIFSIVNTILLRPLPYRDSERMVTLRSVVSPFGKAELGVSKLNFDDIKAQAHSFEAMVTYVDLTMSLTGIGNPEKLSGVGVAPEFLTFFGMHPEVGRDFQTDDAQAKNGNVVLISHGLWQRRFGGDPNIAGRQITFDGQPYTVAGVTPIEFNLPYDFYKPLTLADDMTKDRGMLALSVYAKLNPRITLTSAQAELDTISTRLAAQYPAENEGVALKIQFLKEQSVKGVRTGLSVLLGAVGFLLAIACANVSNLILARGTRRRKEISLRAALGASRARIARQFLVESLLLALLGGATGMCLAVMGIGVFKAFAPADLPRLDELRLDPAIAGFAFLISSLAGIFCGLAPALQTSHAEPTFAFKDRVTDATRRGFFRSRLRSFLVVTEVALALALMTGSTLMVQSLIRTLHVDPGFRTEQLLTAQIEVPGKRYPSAEALQAFVRRILDEMAGRHDLGRAALSDTATLGNTMSVISFEPKTLGPDQKSGMLAYKSVDPNYFATLGVPLLSGRVFNDHDTLGSTPVTVINESLARQYFAGQNAIGKILPLGTLPEDRRQIVGVVRDIRDVGLKRPPKPQFYLPLLQAKSLSSFHVYLRTHDKNPEKLTPSLQESIWRVDKDLPVTHIESMETTISKSVAEPRLQAWLLSTFAAAGLTLTLIGIYGVVSFSVAQRTQEIGIRMALGAQPGNVLRMTLGQGFRLTLLGTGVGLAATFALGRVIASSLFGVKPSDPATLAGAALLMLTVATLASYIPARRATRVDPMVALREG